MTRKQNLQALLDNVYLGVSMYAEYKAVFPDVKLHTAACLAYNGSLDAAQELHEAVLHERVTKKEVWSLRYGSTTKLLIDFKCIGIGRSDDNPARAWLIAILEALILGCEE